MKDKTGRHPGVSIEKRDRGTYRLRWDTGDKKVSKTLHCSKEEAEQRAIELSNNIHQGRVPDPHATFNSLEKVLENSFYPIRSQQYRERIERSVERAREYLPVKLKDIQPVDIETW